MLDELVKVGTDLLAVEDRLQQAAEKKRQNIEAYFLNIERCLLDSAQQLNNSEVPYGKWGELETYAYEMQAILGKEIGEEKAKELGILLMRTASSNPTKEDVPSIESAAGKFKALANIISVKHHGNRPSRRGILTYVAIGATGLASGLTLDKIITKNQLPTVAPVATNNSPFIDDWEMPTFLSDSVRGTILWDAPRRICDRIKEMTENRFIIKLIRSGETIEILEKVNDGTHKCGYGGALYGNKYKALYFGCTIPFGLNPQEQNLWIYHKENPNDEETYVQSIYKKVGLDNIISFPAGATGSQMGGWFKKEIKSVEDLKNITFRIPGLGGDILEKYFQVTTHLVLENAGKGKYPLDACIEMLKKGEVFDAVEWNGPHDDIVLKLHEAANFYHYPGWWEPGTTFDVQVNRKAWNGLPKNYQDVFKIACFETHAGMLSEYNKKNK
jgi:TRAP-type mannitol/chloroaromatic compound transport system substrate-binding protein